MVHKMEIPWAEVDNNLQAMKPDLTSKTVIKNILTLIYGSKMLCMYNLFIDMCVCVHTHIKNSIKVMPMAMYKNLKLRQTRIN